MDLSRDGLNIGRGEAMFLTQEPGEKKPIAQRIDPSRNACRKRMNKIEARRLELRIALPSHMMETVLDIGLGLRLVQRTQMIGRGHPLPKLLHLRALHYRAQLGLAYEEALQKRLVAELEIGKHAQFFDRAGREVLRFVDDKERTLAFQRELA